MFPEKKIINKSKKIILFNKLKIKKEKKKPSIILKGLTSGMSIHYANCCHPIPGDDVVAFTMPGKGLMVHLKVCEELNTKKNSKINFVNVSWDLNEFNQTSFICELNVEIKNEVGSLGELTSVLAGSKSNIRNLKITERNIDFFILNIEIDVMNLEHLNKIIVSLRASKYIEHVKRI